MATNIIYDRIFKGLKLVLGNKAVIRGSDSTRFNEYISLSMAESPGLIENTGASYAMLYSVNIDLITNRANKTKYMSQMLSDVLESLNDNPAYTADGVYYWHDGQILTSEDGEELDEDDKQLFAHRILWTATHTEIK